MERGGSQHEAQHRHRHGRRNPRARRAHRRSPRPSTVDLRIEGATRTLFEGPVTTDARPFSWPRTAHMRAATSAERGAVIAAAARDWNAAGTMARHLGSHDRAGVRRSPARTWRSIRSANKLLGEFKNGASRRRARCADLVAARRRPRCCSPTRDGTEPLLALSGPATAKRRRDRDAEGHRRGRAPRRGCAGRRPPSRVRRDRHRRTMDGPRRPRPEGVEAATPIRSNRVRVVRDRRADGACGTSRPPPVRRGRRPRARPRGPGRDADRSARQAGALVRPA